MKRKSTKEGMKKTKFTLGRERAGVSTWWLNVKERRKQKEKFKTNVNQYYNRN
jgi:hypothetical protein